MSLSAPSKLLVLGIAAGAATFVAALGASMTDLGPWYQSLVQPAWKPPDIAFGPAWTLIFAVVAIAAVEAFLAAKSDATREWLIGLFAFNGFLNILWSALFFRFKRPDWALIEVSLFWASIVVLVIVAGRVSRRAGGLLLVYLAWVSFAAVLNAAVVRLNPPFGG